MKQLSLIGLMFFMVICSNQVFSQTISYTYDPAGNRTEKAILLQKSAFIKNQNSTEEQNKKVIDNTFTNQAIKIYPNPTTGILEIEIPEDPESTENIQISVWDFYGKKILDKRQEPARTQIDLTGRANGIYFLNLQKGSKISQWKIIKK